MAREFGRTYEAVRQWETRRMPAEFVLRLEALSGVPREELRPDIFGPAQEAKAA